MGQDSQRELQELTTVHNFYLGLLEKSLGHAVPFPAELRPDSVSDIPAGTLETFRNWLDVLDLAMTPPIIRDALKGSSGTETSHALLRYYASKSSPRSGDRDKTDCVITHLFRNPPPSSDGPPSWQRPESDSSYYFVSQAALAFQGELYRALQGLEWNAMSQDHSQILHEFEFFYQELSDFRHFDQIMDSGMVQRVRELKQSLGKSFYHPDALAQMAVWNDVFGRKFDELFHEAAKQIKTFAETVQKEGASILSRLEGDITVKQLAEVETQEILSEDYQHAQDEFRKVSKFKKVVDSKRPSRVAGGPAMPPAVAPPSPSVRPQIPTAPVAAPVPPGNHAAPSGPSRGQAIPQQLKTEVLAVPPSQAVQNAVQEGKIHSAKESIKEHVRTSGPQVAPIITVKNSRITLSAAEVEAFKAEYQGERSFRADYAAVMMNLVAYLSRMIVEVDEYNNKATSAYLWKPHADALAYLLTTFERLRMEAESVMAVARARGLQDKAAALKASLDKLSEYAKTVSQTLQATNQNARP